MPRKQTLIDLIGITLASAVVLWICTSIVGLYRFRCNASNDQIGYVAAGRSLAETGHIDSHVIYPSTLLQKSTKNYIYVPGYYACLAVSYRLFGFGVWQSVLPSLCAHTLTALCAYLIALRFYGRAAGLLAAGLWVVFPGGLFYAVTAMSDPTVTAVAALALTAFAYLPRRGMLWVGPLIVAGASLFRETNALLAIPMALILWSRAAADGGKTRGGKDAVIFIVAAILVTVALLLSPVTSGRISLLKGHFFGGDFATAYTDAPANESLKLTIHDCAAVIPRRALGNAHILIHRVHHEWRNHEVASLVPVLLMLPLALVWGAWKRDPIALGGALLGMMIIVVECSLYLVGDDKPLRLTMIALPLLFPFAAHLWLQLSSHTLGRLDPRVAWWPQAILSLCLLALVVRTTRKGLTAFVIGDGQDDYFGNLVQSLHPDDHTTLAGPHWICLPYVAYHYPIRYSFVPRNKATLDLLCAQHGVSMIILEPASTLTPDELQSSGFRLYRTLRFGETRYPVFRRPVTADEAGDWPLADGRAIEPGPDGRLPD